MKKYSKLIFTTILITLLPVLIGLLLWERLPDTIATHWNASGTADGWSSKPYAVFAMPCFLAVMQIVLCIITLNDPKRKHIHKKPLLLVLWIIPVLSLLLNAATYMIALSIDINMVILVSALAGVLFIILGNYMPKLRQNYTIGIRLPWTLASEENWNRTHRLGGKVWIAGGLFIIAGGLAGVFLGDAFAFAALIAAVLVCALIPSVYSFWLFRHGI